MSEGTINNIEMIRKSGLEKFMNMVPDAIRLLSTMLGDPAVPPNVKAMLIQMILDRGLGKPEENIRIQHMDDSMDEAQERLDAIFEQVRKKMGAGE